MKLGHILWVNQSPEHIGGCEWYIANTAGFLNARGVRSSLLYGGAAQPAGSGMLGRFESAWPIGDIRQQVEEVAPDLVYVHRLSGVEPVSELARSGVPVVRLFHDYQIFCLREHKYKTLTHRTCSKPIGLRCYPCLGFIRRSQGPWKFSLARVGSLKAEIRANMGLTGFVAGSRYMAGHVAAHGIDPGKIRTIPLYAIPPEHVVSATREDDLLLFAGQLIRGKGLDVLLRALAKMKRRARLMVVGSGRQEGMFRDLCKALGLDDRVAFKGRIPQQSLFEYYAKAACVVVPSRYPETFGLIGPEAMSHGAPVIATTVGGIGEWLEDGVTGLAVPPNDSGRLAEAMDRLLGDREMAARMGEAALERYNERFRPERHVDALIEYFESLIGEG